MENIIKTKYGRLVNIEQHSIGEMLLFDNQVCLVSEFKPTPIKKGSDDKDDVHGLPCKSTKCYFGGNGVCKKSTNVEACTFVNRLDDKNISFLPLINITEYLNIYSNILKLRTIRNRKQLKLCRAKKLLHDTTEVEKEIEDINNLIEEENKQLKNEFDNYLKILELRKLTEKDKNKFLDILIESKSRIKESVK